MPLGLFLTTTHHYQRVKTRNDCTTTTTEMLDVEDAEERLGRLQNALERLNSAPTTTCSDKPATIYPNFSFLNRDPMTRPQYVSPPTELLKRVHAFLPIFEASNAQLETQDPTSINIEHLEGHEGHSTGGYIEMNLGLGLFDVKGSLPPSIPMSMPMPPSRLSFTSSSFSSASSASSTSHSTSVRSEEDSDVTWDSDSDSDAEIITCFTPIRPIKPLPRRARPRIEVLGTCGSTISDPGIKNGEGG